MINDFLEQSIWFPLQQVTDLDEKVVKPDRVFVTYMYKEWYPISSVLLLDLAVGCEMYLQVPYWLTFEHYETIHISSLGFFWGFQGTHLGFELSKLILHSCWISRVKNNTLVKLWKVENVGFQHLNSAQRVKFIFISVDRSLNLKIWQLQRMQFQVSFAPCHYSKLISIFVNHFQNNFLFQFPEETVAIKSITKKNIAKSQNLLSKEIKILKVSCCPLIKQCHTKTVVSFSKDFHSPL